MKLYSYPGAPNPRRVLIFAAEKGIELDVINVDLPGGEIKTPEFLEKNPSGKIPVLELDDGRTIAESVAISRYLEALFPEPNLFGADPFEIAQIEMQHRFIEFELNDLRAQRAHLFETLQAATSEDDVATTLAAIGDIQARIASAEKRLAEARGDNAVDEVAVR